MATRRIIATEKTILDKDDPIEEKSDIAPAVPKDVIYKLLAFTIGMIVLPIGSYFLTVNTIFRGNSSFAGGFAAVMANVVLVAYIIVAMKEENAEQTGKPKSDSKKDQ
ncbi:Vacuolar ATPase assembly integral membrane protein VMA21 [Fusarium falciforme]|uniref:Vacuolar ATPase assembly integral membrane protein VMA21 n=1 Tax=Fusarium falciforme TaxID=195108 RepID=UPI002300CC51|nr:Vacuolar ATPase assembly integral membrane protein VMA21 [Fusarium falciforme]WAO83392.1 Vacuolar ATPase assembly integral membrane protein VMA21 [Fusarium falciforme]